MVSSIDDACLLHVDPGIDPDNPFQNHCANKENGAMIGSPVAIIDVDYNGLKRKALLFDASSGYLEYSPFPLRLGGDGSFYIHAIILPQKKPVNAGYIIANHTGNRRGSYLFMLPTYKMAFARAEWCGLEQSVVSENTVTPNQQPVEVVGYYNGIKGTVTVAVGNASRWEMATKGGDCQPQQPVTIGRSPDGDPNSAFFGYILSVNVLRGLPPNL